jgi:branched-chain amino acid transport system permease protein
MDTALVQFLSSGVTEGARYALAALGFTLIYNASGAINFAQGESIMLGGMMTAILLGAGMPFGVAMGGAVLIALLASVMLQKLATRTLTKSGVLTVIILTVAFGMILRGFVQAFWGTQTRSLPAFTGADPLRFLGGTILPQTLWVIGVTAVVLLALAWFFRFSRLGRAFMAAAYNAETAQLMGINVRFILLIAFVISGVLGAVAGIVTGPITYTSYDVGMIVGLKAIIAAIVGGMGSVAGAVVGGLLLGLAEALTAGYISSEYKDAVPFLLVVLVFLVRPSGLFGRPHLERV